MSDADEAQATYDAMLERAKGMQFDDFKSKGLLYVSESKETGARRVVLVPSRLEGEGEEELDRAVHFFLISMDTVVSGPYHVLVCQTGMSWFSTSHFSLIRRVYAVLPREYKKNLASLHVLHPTAVTRAAFFFLRPVLQQRFWRKLHYVESAEEARRDLGADLPLPALVTGHDAARRARRPSALARFASFRRSQPGESAGEAPPRAAARFFAPFPIHALSPLEALPPLRGPAAMPGTVPDTAARRAALAAVRAGAVLVPVVVARCLAWLEAGDSSRLRTEGIYRLPGSLARVRRLQQEYHDTGDFAALLGAAAAGEAQAAIDGGVVAGTAGAADAISVQDVASLLKSAFRDSAEPAVSLASAQRLTARVPEADAEDEADGPWAPGPGSAPVPGSIAGFAEAAREEVSALPEVPRRALWATVVHLRRVAAVSAENRMTVRNLAMVFAPGLMPVAPDVPPLEVLRLMPRSIAATFLLLRYAPLVFPEEDLHLYTGSGPAASSGVDDDAAGSQRQPIRGGRFASVTEIDIDTVPEGGAEESADDATTLAAATGAPAAVEDVPEAGEVSAAATVSEPASADEGEREGEGQTAEAAEEQTTAAKDASATAGDASASLGGVEATSDGDAGH